MSALRTGGLTPFTTIDYPGQLAAVVFVQGCPWRCGYCHNPHLQAHEPPGRSQGEYRSASARRLPDDRAPAGAPAWADLQPWLQRRAGLIDAVVFSGGEPTGDPALPAAMAQARAFGLKVGLHTAGIYPQRLQAALPLADWVGLDVKAPLSDEACHARITGVRGSAAAVRASLAALVSSGVSFECRTTAHPALLDDAALLALASELADAGVASWALQIFRATGCAAALAPVAADYPAPATLARLAGRFESFTLRRG